jgi:glycosyltransferase involved in cell wall biosynthesis
MLQPRICFYDDAATFGGHELMTLRLVERLAGEARYDITFIASRSNTELCSRLAAVVPRIKVMPTPYTSSRGQWLRTYLSVVPLLHLRRWVKSVSPALLIVVQGGIALSSLGLLAGRLAGVRTVSYLPMAHDESMFAPTPLRAWLRQWLVLPFYRLPECVVTISARMAACAQRRRPGAVRVVENGVSLPGIDASVRDAERAALGLKDADRLLLMVGRIEFWQKRHDLAVQALAQARSRGARLHLLVVGSGPDEAALRDQVQALGLSHVVHWRAWQSDVRPFYAACDALLLPSRYEGVPLVMLEAMCAGRRILAADVDGMVDMLPAAWTFPSGDIHSLVDLLCAPGGAADAEHLHRHRGLMAERFTLAAFGNRFLQVIDEQLALAAADGSARS